jgi:GxxExxY protein
MCGLDYHSLDHMSERIIRCAFTVSNTLGAGFLEKVYENALVHELRKAGFQVTQQANATVMYDGVIVGNYIADIVVENTILMEIKAVRALDKVHGAQCLNYLRTTGLRLCLLLNFGNPRLEVRRFVCRL